MAATLGALPAELILKVQAFILEQTNIFHSKSAKKIQKPDSRQEKPGSRQDKQIKPFHAQWLVPVLDANSVSYGGSRAYNANFADAVLTRALSSTATMMVVHVNNFDFRSLTAFSASLSSAQKKQINGYAEAKIMAVLQFDGVDNLIKTHKWLTAWLNFQKQHQMAVQYYLTECDEDPSAIEEYLNQFVADTDASHDLLEIYDTLLHWKRDSGETTKAKIRGWYAAALEGKGKNDDEEEQAAALALTSWSEDEPFLNSKAELDYSLVAGMYIDGADEDPEPIARPHNCYVLQR